MKKVILLLSLLPVHLSQTPNPRLAPHRGAQGPSQYGPAPQHLSPRFR
jgi:hypothetical protein